MRTTLPSVIHSSQSIAKSCLDLSKADSIVNRTIDEKVSFGDALIQISDGCIFVTHFEIMSPTSIA